MKYKPELIDPDNVKVWPLKEPQDLTYDLKMKPLKIYILIKDWIDVGHAVNGVGHAVLILDEKYKDDPLYKDWRTNSFRKVTCKVSEKEFEDAKQYGDFIVATEMAFDNKEIMLAFAPREEWPKRFKYFRLYK